MITTEIKKMPASQIEMTISINWDEWKKFINEAVAEYSKEIKIEGFRPGKAPKELVEQKVGKKALLDLAAQKAIHAAYPEVLKEKNIEAIGSPKVEVLKLAEGNSLEYKAVTAVMPEITMGKWKDSIKKINKEFSNKKEEVTNEEIEEEIGNIAKSRVQHVTVDRVAQDGDNAVLDFEVRRDGVPIENGSSKNHPLILGRGVFIPGFEEKVVGMKAGEEKEFELEFPKEYHEKSLAGKKATFLVKVNEVQERKTPEVSDAFARSLGKFENLEDMRKSVAEGMVEEKKQQFKEKRRLDFIDALAATMDVELPHVLIHEELHRMIHEFDHQLQGMGMSFDQYLVQIGKTADEIEEEWEPQAIKRIKASLSLGQVAKDEQIEPSNEEVEAEMNKTLAQYKKIKDVEKNIDLGQLYNYVKGIVQNEKVFAMLEELQ